VLLLGGTAEARVLAERLAGEGIDTVASLAGVTRAPAAYGVPVRTGGFGGATGLADWLRAEGVRALVDATHPFAARMPWNAAAACAATGVPRLRLLRPEWPVRPAWILVGSAAEAARALPAGARVLLAMGREAAPFAEREDCRFWLRSIEPVELPPHIEPLLARPPFAPDTERALMQRLGVTHLVARNSGGDAAKLDAAGALGLAVVIVARPPTPPGPLARTVDEALAWLAGALDRADAPGRR
jgi:precorrin-6A/cobalt-precorrin-6A reductase